MSSVDFFAPINSWPEFVARLSHSKTENRGYPFELVVQHYLRSDPAYRTKLRHVWLLVEVPELIHRQLNLPHADQGIDLIAETHAGEFWAIQAKYRSDTNASLTHRELATFTSLAFTVCRGINYGLICTTTARIPGILTGLANLGDLTNETWAGLTPEFFASLRASLATGALPPRPQARTPLSHQTRAVAAAVSHFRDKAERRGKLISPCGSGKSLTACWIAQALDARRVLIAVPSIALIRQTLETRMHEALARDDPTDWLCVCSDTDVTKSEKAELIAHVHELGLPCDTDPATLAAHLTILRDRPGQIVVMTTYQSSPVLSAAAQQVGFSFDLAVLDEAHRTTGQKAKSFAHLLFDENLPLPRRLFMTATERRFQGSSDDVVSMDDPALYGGTFELLSFKAAIAATPPILSDYRILTIGVRESEVARLVEANRWLDLGTNGLDEVTAQALASLVALRRATTEHGVRHTVSFHSSIARAKQFRDLCGQLNATLSAETHIAPHHVNGGMGSAARQRELAAFLAATSSLVTNARCLTEGVDVPSIDCVFFADPKGSTIEIVQAAGRALRLDPSSGKTMGYILLPLVVKDGATLDEVAESSAFKFVLFVLRALATHDERIIEWFRATAEGRTPEIGGLVHFDLGQVVTPLGVNAADFARQIEVRCWEKIATLSFRSFEDARTFARTLGVRTFLEYWKTVDRLAQAGMWPADVPKDPSKTYRLGEWNGWREYLGTGARLNFRRVPSGKRTYWPFEQARAFARNLRLQSSVDWQKYGRGEFPSLPRIPDEMPYAPNNVYDDSGWIGWDDFLGVGWMPFEQARACARSLKLSGQRQWKQYCKKERPDLPPKPDDIPAAPWKAYEHRGWIGWRDWLGTTKPTSTVTKDAPKRTRPIRRNRASRFRNFESARAFVHSLQLESSTQWQAYLDGKHPEKPDRPKDIPRSPRNVYRAQWKGWGDWIGRPENIAPFRRQFRSFEEARTFARTLGLRTGEDWQKWSVVPGNRPFDIPSRPESTYADEGWIDWPDFLQPSK